MTPMEELKIGEVLKDQGASDYAAEKMLDAV